MPLEPRFQRRRGGDSLPRTFVDREQLLADFQAALDRPDRSRPKVLVLYGLAGIGKSRLKREIRDRTAEDDRETLWAEVDFSLPTLREPQTALFSLRRQLSDRHHVRFPTFDLAYAYLWKLARPNIAPHEEGRALFEAGNMAASLLSSAGVPLVSFVAQAVEKGSKPVKAWWIKRGRDDLKELSQLDPGEIEERLPAYLAEDLAEYLDEEQLSAVICFDTYEALFADVRSEERRLLQDEWLRELILQLPSVLFVISGRERLDWEKLDPEWGALLEQKEMQELPEKDARTFLSAASLTDTELQDLIVKETGNLPFLLDLILDTVEETKRAGKEVRREDLTGWGSAVEFRMAERFLRYLSPAEQDTVEVLAVPRFFDEPLFRDLCTSFETQFPLGQFREICRFSFIFERSPGTFQMHDIMAESLRARLGKRDPQRLKTLHSFLFQRFDQKLERMRRGSVDPEQEQAFLEAFFHAEQTLTIEETTDWFIKRMDGFREAGRDRPLLNAARTLAADTQRILGPRHPKTIQSLACLGGLNLPDPKENESVLRQALEAARSAGRPAEDLVPGILTNLARTLFFRQNRFEEAEPLLREALSLLEDSPALDECGYCFAAASLSACLAEDGDPQGARDVCMHAMSMVKKDNPNQFYLWVVNNLSYHDVELGYLLAAEKEAAECYELMAAEYTDQNYNLWTTVSTLGEIRFEQHRYEEAESLLERCLELLESADYARGAAEVLALLAENCSRSGKLDLARDYVNRGLQVAETLRIRTKFLTTLARVSLEEGSYEESETLLAESLANVEEILPRDHPWFSVPYLVWGELNRRQGRFPEAEEHLHRALAIVESRLRPEHPRAGEILIELARLRQDQGRAEEARQLRERGQAIRLKEGCVL